MVLEKRIVEQLPIGATLTTYDGRVLYANPKAYELLAIDPDDVDDLDVNTLYPYPDQRKLMIESVKGKAGGSDQDMGHYVHLYVEGVPMLFHSMSAAFDMPSGEDGVILSAFWRA